MERKVVTDRVRLLRVLATLAVMAAVGAVVDYSLHLSFRSWFVGSFAPIVVGGSGALLLVYLAMKLKQNILRPPNF
ncbi:hypothetical protein HDF17_001205 [Granulicella arctica]|uniref:Uncharacterized protein n=1 Tax=Granulicella arctica TaxID=940613 RepID=A0A7Y9PGW7_9BACT|nr:hypothetical protein [Granulicella arctica]